MSKTKRVSRFVWNCLEKNLAIGLILIGTTVGLILEIYG